MNTNSQNAAVLAILKSGGSITQLEAARWEDPCLRLGARIWDLRNGVHDGTRHDIEELKEKNGDGKGYHARYRMRVQAPVLPPAFEPKPEPKAENQTMLFAKVDLFYKTE